MTRSHMTHSLHFFFVICFLGFVCSVVGQDPCYLPANSGTIWIGLPSQLLACFDNIPFSLSRANSTLTLLRQLIQLYSFTDIAKNSGPPWNMQVDLAAGLDAIEANFSRYTNDYAFHSDIMRLFSSLNDAHTFYAAPIPYFNCFLMRPFSVFAYYNGTGLRISLNLGYFDASPFIQFASFDPRQYYGRELQQIDGQPILNWLQNYANRFVSYYKDPAIRFGQLFSRRSSFSIVSLALFSLYDLSQNETWTIDGTSVSVPKIVVCTPTANTSSWITAIDTPRPNSKRKRSIEHEYERVVDVGMYREIDVHKEYQRHTESILGPLKRPLITTLPQNNKPQQQSKRAFRAITSPNTITLSLVEGNASNLQVMGTIQTDSSAWWGLYTDQGGNTFAILKLKTFLPTNESEFRSFIENWLIQVQTRNISHVIVDVSGNGGGRICLALFLLAALVPEWSDGSFSPNRSQQIWEPYDLRHSQIWNYLVNFNYFNPQQYRQMSGASYTSNEWYYPGVNRTRGGVNSTFSFPSAFPYSDCYPNYFTNRSFFPSNVMVITDGTCGSACSLFVTKLRYYQRAIIVSHGGFPGTDMDCSSFGGGNVVQWQDFASTIAPFPGFPNKPIPFTTSAYASFTQHELYMGENTTTPREWDRFPANYHLYWWDAIFVNDVTLSGGPQIFATLYESASRAWGLVTTPVSPFPSPTTTLPPPPTTTSSPSTTTTPPPSTPPPPPTTTTTTPLSPPPTSPPIPSPPQSTPSSLPSPSFGPPSRPPRVSLSTGRTFVPLIIETLLFVVVVVVVVVLNLNL